VRGEKRARAEFSRIYAENAWGMGSGIGSMPEYTADYADLLQSFMEERGVRSVVDFGCGDWQFSRHLDWKGRDYLGVDVVEDVIERNRRQYGTESIRFELMRDAFALPGADLLVCKDVLQHLPNDVIRTYLRAFKAKYTYMLITNDISYEDHRAAGAPQRPPEANVDIDFGEWHAIRLEQPPFGEAVEVLLDWSVDTSEHLWVKRTYLLLGGKSGLTTRARIAVARSPLGALRRR
jgi:SAM-dependent methyltransferase